MKEGEGRKGTGTGEDLRIFMHFNFQKKINLFFKSLTTLIFFTVYLRKSALLIHQGEAVHWFFCQSVYNFLVVNKSDRAPIQTLATIFSLDNNEKNW